MHGHGESYSGIVPAKQPNQSGPPPAEAVEGRPLTKENRRQSNPSQTPSWASGPSGLERVRQAARKDGKLKFTALLHHVTKDLLRESYHSLKRQAAPGVDGVTWTAYGQGLEDRLADLEGRIHRGAYRAQPSRRVWIPKPDGSVPGNCERLDAFRKEVVRLWYRALHRRSQRSRLRWATFGERLAVLLPTAQILHPYPNLRFDAKYPSIRGKNRVR